MVHKYGMNLYKPCLTRTSARCIFSLNFCNNPSVRGAAPDCIPSTDERWSAVTAGCDAKNVRSDGTTNRNVGLYVTSALR